MPQEMALTGGCSPRPRISSAAIGVGVVIWSALLNVRVKSRQAMPQAQRRAAGGMWA